MSDLLFVSYSGVLGGAERVLIEFAAALGGGRSLACPEGELADRARAQGIRVFPLKTRRLDVRARPARAAVDLLAHRREVRRLHRDLRPALTIASGSRAALALLLPRPAGRLVFLHHDLLRGPLARGLVRSAAARAALVVVPSRTVADDLGVPAVVVHPGVDAERFAPVNGRPPADPPQALVLGAIVPWKRPELALSALSLARRRRPDLRIRIVGAPLGLDGAALMEELRERVATDPALRGAVDLVGPTDDVEGELARATCLLHCAAREPFGLAVLEALAAGRPIVAPAAGGPAEIVDDSCALLYPPGDAQAAADALVTLAGEPELAARMGAAGRTLARERFDVSNARRRFASAIDPLLAVPPAARPRREDRLALVTVTHNSAPELRRLLASAARHLPGVRVVVVDNASSDQSVAVARELGAEVIALEQNVGFGRACNVGVATVAEPVTVLVNPDVELVDDSLLTLSSEALVRRDWLFAPLVLSPDGSRQDTVHRRPASPGDLVGALIPGNAFAPWHSARPRRVGWAVGCALVGATDALRRLGPFDERIFLYGEDLDLGLRTETWFWPMARVVHTRAHSTTRTFGGAEPFELLARARHDVVARRLGRTRARLDDALQRLTFAWRIALKATLGIDTVRERRQLDALRSLR